MKQDSRIYQTYLQILNRELIPAMGCTEPIAIAYGAAKAREVLGSVPEWVRIEASGNIIKNVKSVIVPNTGGKRGIPAAAAAGIIAGDSTRGLEVIASVTEQQKEEMGHFLQSASIAVLSLPSEHVLDFVISMGCGSESACIRIVNEHTNLVLVKKNETILMEREITAAEAADGPDYSLLSINDIFDFVNTVRLEDVKPLLQRQIECNQAISKEGLTGDYGANVGKVLLKAYGTDLKTRAKAKAAAGSDARMNGCELPVVINSGSGNQGITASIPVLEYAAELGCSMELTYRGLLLSNLVTLHLKSGIGRLSAYCGAVSAGAGAGAGIAYLCTGSLDMISHTIVNALAITSGIVCDGAKASCAAKIASAVDVGILGFELYQNGQQFYSGDGLVSKGVENTIRNIGILGREGMQEADKTIIEIMTGC